MLEIHGVQCRFCILAQYLKGNPDMKKNKITSEPPVSMSASSLTSDTSGKNNFIFWIVGTFLVALFYMILKMYSMQPYVGDESIYIYQGKMLAQGFTPYRDYAMAHPPVQTIFIAAVIKLFGYSLLGFRMIPILWTLIAGILLSVMVRKELGSIAAVFSMALFILAYEPLRASIHFTGVNMTITLLMASLLAHRNKKIILCAVFAILAIYTRLYALPAVFALLLITFYTDKKVGINLLKWELLLGFSLFIIFGLWTGFGSMINDIFLFQAQKTKMSLDKLNDMRDGVLFHNSIPLILFILGSVTLLVNYMSRLKNADASHKKNQKKIETQKQNYTLLHISVLTVFLTLGILLNMSRVWMYYYVLAFPYAAITGGWMVAYWIKQIRLFIPNKSSIPSTDQKASIPWLIGSLVIFLLFWANSSNFEKKLDYYKDAVLVSSSKHRTVYTWRDAPLPGIINNLVKALIWKDERVIGDRYAEFTYYLWHCSRVLDIKDEVVAVLNQVSTMDDEIFGDSGTVPLFALLCNRRVAGNEIDTNIERYRSGNADPDQLIKNIDKPQTRFIFLQDNFGVAVLPQVQRLVQLKYKFVKSFASATGTTLKMYERLPG
ncbi:hypothetical protein BH11BAC2_BH11BAC2_00100 [soil metagenome]